MPRPQLKMPKGTKTPSAKPKKNLGKSTLANEPAPEEEKPEVSKARTAVEKFEQEHGVLRNLRANWEEDYREASEALFEVKSQEDIVGDLIKKAKPLVSKAKQTIGEFKAQRKWDSAHYDGAELSKIITEAEDWGELFGALLEAGLIQLISVDKDDMISWCAKNPAFAERFLDAWVDEVEMTTAVTVPKI